MISISGSKRISESKDSSNLLNPRPLGFEVRRGCDIRIQANFEPRAPGTNITATPLAVIAPDSYFLLIFQLAGHDSHLSFLRHALFGGWGEIPSPGPHRPLCQMRS